MATTFDPSPETIVPISYDEFLDSMNLVGALELPKKIEETSILLRRVCENRDFLAEKMRDWIERFLTQRNPCKSRYSPATFVLHTNRDYVFRANVWMPSSREIDVGTSEDQVFSYRYAHDHDFDLVTAGYLGSGYTTHIYEYDLESTQGYVGEQVCLRFLESTKLPQGKVVHFRRKKDVHVQLPPKELSISLNILFPNSDPAFKLGGYGFELGENEGPATIIEHLGSLENGTITLLDILRNLPGAESVSVARMLSEKSESRRIRSHAGEILKALS